MIVSLIVAASENNVIGRNGDMPWRLPDDLKFFRAKTQGHPIIMGRKTYESLPAGALPGRENIVVTREQTYDVPGVQEASSLDEAIMFAARDNDAEEVFIIGGGEIFRQAMERADRIYMTRVHADIEGDVYFPEIDPGQWKETERTEHPADEKHAYAFTFQTLERAENLQV